MCFRENHITKYCDRSLLIEVCNIKMIVLCSYEESHHKSEVHNSRSRLRFKPYF